MAWNRLSQAPPLARAALVFTGAAMMAMGGVLGMAGWAGAGMVLAAVGVALPGPRAMALLVAVLVVGGALGLYDAQVLSGRLGWMNRLRGTPVVTVQGVVTDVRPGAEPVARLRLTPSSIEGLTYLAGRPLFDGFAGESLRLSGLEKLARQPAPGEVWAFTGRLRPPGKPLGFASYDPRLAAARRGELGWLRVREGALQQTLGGPRWWVPRLRQTVARRLFRQLPEETAAVTAALTLGMHSPGSARLAEQMRHSGTLHLLVVSGAHLGLLAAAVWLGSRLLGVGYHGRLALMVLAVGLYGAAAGGVALSRAAVMVVLLVLARLLGRRVRLPVALSVAVLALVAADAAVVLNPGFWLSVCATAAVLVAVRQAWVLPEMHHTWLDGALRGLWVGVWAATATAPLLALFFQSVAPIGPVATVLLLPVVTALLVVGLLMVGVGVWVAPVGAALAWVLNGLATVLAVLVDHLAALPGAGWTVSVPEALALSGAVAAAMGALLWWRRRLLEEDAVPHGDPLPEQGRVGPSTLVGAAVVLVGVAALWPAFHRAPPVRVDVLSVGQGEAMLFTGPKTGTVLVDGGPWWREGGRAHVMEALRTLGVRRVDLLVASHGDADHVGGLLAVLEELPVGAVVLPGGDRRLSTTPDTDTLRDFLAALEGHNVLRVGAGDVLTHGVLTLRVLAPPKGTVCRRNACGLVMAAQVDGLRMLLTSDAPMDDETLRTSGLGAMVPPVHVLRLAHHGSLADNGPLLLSRTQPRLAVVSAGHANPYGHPHPVTVEEVARAGIPLWRTDAHGTVTLTMDRRGQVRVLSRF